MTTTNPTPILVTRVPRLQDDQDNMRQLTDGLGNAVAGLDIDELDALYGEYPATHAGNEHPAVVAWDRLTNEVIAEVAPAVAELLNAAIDKRLPVTL